MPVGIPKPDDLDDRPSRSGEDTDCVISEKDKVRFIGEIVVPPGLEAHIDICATIHLSVEQSGHSKPEHYRIIDDQ